MITRLVKMSFRSEETEAFIQLFYRVKPAIENFPGCSGVTLIRDTLNPHVFFTVSTWDHPDSLEKYRNSALFNDTWAQTKIKFNDRPEAWSCREVDSR